MFLIGKDWFTKCDEYTFQSNLVPCTTRLPFEYLEGVVCKRSNDPEQPRTTPNDLERTRTIQNKWNRQNELRFKTKSFCVINPLLLKYFAICKFLSFLAERKCFLRICLNFIMFSRIFTISVCLFLFFFILQGD